MSSNRASKRPSRAKQPWEKMRAINRVEMGESKAAVARALDVPESTLRGWCKNREKIEALVKQPGGGPPSASVVPVENPEGPAAKRLKVDDSAPQISPQNLTVKNGTPSPSRMDAAYPAAMDLSRTSPVQQPTVQQPSVQSTNRPVENGRSMSSFYEAARLFHMMQQAQNFELLAGNGRNPLMASAARQVMGGIPNLPNEPLPTAESVRQWLNTSNPSQVSPNSSSATLSTPFNGQPTTSPLAGNTPEQHLYMEMYKALAHTLGLAARYNIPVTSPNMPALYQQSMLNYAGRSASYPVSPNQSARGQVYAEQPRSDLNSSDQTRRLAVPLAAPEQRNSSPASYQSPGTSRQSASPSSSGRSSIPSTSAQFFMPSTESQSSIPSTSGQSYMPSTSAQLFVPSTSAQSIPSTSQQFFMPYNRNHFSIPSTSRDQSVSPDTSCSTLDLSKKVKIEPLEEDQKPVQIETESVAPGPIPAAAEPEPAKVQPVPKREPETPKQQPEPVKVEAGPSVPVAGPSRAVARPAPKGTRSKRSLAKVLNTLSLNAERRSQVDIAEDIIHDGIRMTERLLQFLQRNSDHPSINSEMMSKVESVLTELSKK